MPQNNFGSFGPFYIILEKNYLHTIKLFESIINMRIRKAMPDDFEELYRIGLSTKELRVSATEPFMDKDDFKLRIKDKKHVFLLAEADKKIVGFVCANTKDLDRPLKNKY